MTANRICLSVTIPFSVFATAAAQTNISMDFFSSNYGPSGYIMLTRDQTTGTYYTDPGAGNGPINAFFSEAALAANTPDATIPLNPNDIFGGYNAVLNGEIYGRRGNQGSSIGRWSLSGTLDAAMNPVPNVGGVNFNDTFSWGGDSGLNFFSDQGGLHLFGGDANSNGFLMLDLAPDLSSVLRSQTVPGSLFGFGFDIDGHFFTGNFSNGRIDQDFDIETGTARSVDFQLTGFPSASPYITTAYYDQLSDSLFIWQHTDVQEMLVVRNAAAKFGVPEPLSILAFAGGLAVLGRRRFKR